MFVHRSSFPRTTSVLIALFLLLIAIFAVAQAAAGQAALPVTEDASPAGQGQALGWAARSSMSLRNELNGLLQEPTTTTLELAIVSSPWATLDSNPGVGEEVPKVFVVEAVITNTGSVPARDLVVNLDYNEEPADNWVLLPGEDPNRSLDELAPGAAYHAYWFASYSLNYNATHQYTVTVDAANADLLATFENYYENPDGATVKTRSTLSTGNSGVTRTSAAIAVGVAFTVTVDYDLGSNPVDAHLSPVGNVDFAAGAYRLLASQVRFSDSGANPLLTVDDRLYFPALPASSMYAQATYTFIAITLEDTRLCPYTTVGYSSSHKYDQFYCSDGKLTIVPITGTLSLSMTKAVSSPAVEQNGLLTYTIHYTNSGNLPLNYVWIWDDVDPNIASVLTETAAPPADPDETTGSRVAWYLDTVVPGDTGTLTFTLLVDGGGSDLPDGTPLVNRAFFGINQGSVPAEAALTSTVTSTVLAPDVAMTKTDGRDAIEPGEALTYTLRITNSGSVPATNVVISDVLPAEVSYLSGTADPPPTGVSGQTLTWEELGPILPGQSVVITVPVTVDGIVANGTELLNTASMRYQNNAGWTFDLLTAEDATVVIAPVLSILKAGSPDPVLTGQAITYTLSYENSGPVMATNVVISDVVPENTVYVTCSGGSSCGENGGIVQWELGTLPGESSGSVVFAVQVGDSLATGSLISNDDYGISADQTGFIAGPAVTTVVNRNAAIFDGYTFVDANGNGLYDDGVEATLPGITITLPASTESPTVTNDSGYYRLRVEVAGPVSVSAELPPGYFRTTAGTVLTDSVLGLTQTVDFGYAPTDAGFGVVYGTVYADADHNGQRDLGESGLPGVMVGSGTAVTPSVQTDGDGRYTLRYDVPGPDPVPVTISEEDPLGYISTTPNEVTTDVANGASEGSPVDFGDFYGLLVSGQVFEDADVDGMKDALEHGVADAVVTGNGDTFTTTETGVYTLYVTLEDTQAITVEETDPAGYVSTAALPGAGMEVVDRNTLLIPSPLSGNHYTDGDFGDVQAGTVVTITGTVWDDNGALGGTLANGLRDGGEPGLAGALVSLDSGLGQLTGADGAFLLYALPAQAITVTETNPDGYVSTNAIPGNNATKVSQDALLIELPPGTLTSSENLFGDVALGSVAVVTGTVFDDANENGVRDGGEVGLPGVTVTLEIEGGTAIALTGALGDYQFVVAPDTNVRLSSTGPGGDYYPTTPESLVVPAPAAGMYYPDYNFGYSDDPDVAVIYGLVFEDLDQDGLRGIAEPGLAEVLLTLDAVLTATTDLNGSYTFSVTEPISHTVVETDPEDYQSTTPNTVTVAVQLGDSAEVNFGDLWLGHCGCLPDAYEEDDEVGQAAALTAGLTQTHDFCDDAGDWTWFSAEAGQVVTLTTSSWGRRADTFLALYDAGGTTLLAANDDYEGSTDFSSRIVWQSPADGTYSVRVSNRAGLTGCLTDYELWLETPVQTTYWNYLPVVATNVSLAPVVVVEAVDEPRGVINHICPDEYEVDDTWQQAGPIELGVPQVHSFDSNTALYAADKDFVSLSLAAGDHVVVRITNLTNTLTLLELYDGQGNVLGPTGESELNWKAAQDAMYIVGISPLTPTFGCVTEVAYEVVAEMPRWLTVYLPLALKND